MKLSKEANAALSQLKAEMYHCLDTADKAALRQLRSRIRTLQQLADELDSQIEEEIKAQAKQMSG